MRTVTTVALVLTGCLGAGGGGGGGAGSGDGGVGTPDAGDPTVGCEGVVCGGVAHCERGACVCNEGFVLEGLDCVPEPLPETGERSEAVVCERWAADHVNVRPEWTPGDGEACDLGEVAEGAQENAIRRANLYRWLAGLEPLQFAPDLFDAVQACSMIQSAQGDLDHTPPPSAPCYTELGATTAAQSNLSLGSGMAGSVDAYVGDQGVPSLGHRRWVLNPPLREAAFGLVGGASCMHVFRSGSAEPTPFVAWPTPGYVPLAAARGTWSVAFFEDRGSTEETAVTVEVDGGGPLSVDFQELDPGYGNARSTLAFEPPGEVYVHGTTVTVTVTGLTDGEERWTTRFTDCQ